MARKSLRVREIKRSKLVSHYASKREALKKSKDYQKLDKLPKNSSKVRLHNRCSVTGRPKGYLRKFGVSRIIFRDWASQGNIPGLKKASW